MAQEQKAQGWEGRRAPALLEGISTSGGKPPFPTLRFPILVFLSGSVVISQRVTRDHGIV